MGTPEVSTSVALLLVVVGLALVIMLHELGHLVVAKACGMRVTQYFVGFGPRVWSIRRGETEYGLRAIPAGGFVKIPGMSNLEEVDEADEGRTYRQATFPRKVAVASAGSVVHFLLAFAMLWTVFAFLGMPGSTLDAVGIAYDGKVVVAGITGLGPHQLDPARAAGLKVGDQIVSVDGHPVHSNHQLVGDIRPNAGKRLTLTVSRKGALRELRVTPIEHNGHGMIGISEAIVGQVRAGPLSAVPWSLRWMGRYVATVATSVGSEFSNLWHALTTPSLTANSVFNENRPMSVVGATRLAAHLAQTGATPVLLIFVMLNIFIGIFNLLPVPVLDGGHVAVAVYERLRTRHGRTPYHADFAKLMPLVYATVMVLIVLGGSLVYLDIVKPVPSPFR